jgi:hypothetical protein
MIVGREPGPQLHPLTGPGEKLQQCVADGDPAAPRPVGWRWQLGQYVCAHPVAGPLRIELGGYRVVLPTLLVHHPDGDQLYGDAILDELAVVEEPTVGQPTQRW